MSDRPDMQMYDEGSVPGEWETFNVGLPFMWLGISGSCTLLMFRWLIGALMSGGSGAAVAFVLFFPTGVLTLVIFVRSLRSATKLAVEGDRLVFSSLLRAKRTVDLSDLREVRLEKWWFLRQLTFETDDFTSVVVKAGLRPSRLTAIVGYVKARPHMLFAGKKNRMLSRADPELTSLWWRLEHGAPYRATSVKDIEQWLAGCEYRHDISGRFMNLTRFEELRQGDTFLHAVWAWNKLHRLGIDAEFCVGVRVLPHGQEVDSYWVIFRQGRMVMNFETTDKTGTGIQPQEAVRDTYITKYSVDIRNRRFRHYWLYYAGS